MSESTITKKALAASFKELLRKKKFDKISIQEIANQATLNRQTFYYHFQDKYELLEWMYYEEAFVKALNGLTLDNWEQQFAMLFQIMKDDRAFYEATIHFDSKPFFDYILKLSSSLFCDAMNNLDKKHLINDQNKQFYARFYAFGFSSSIIEWVYTGMKQEPKQLAYLLKRMVIDTEKLAYDHHLEVHS